MANELSGSSPIDWHPLYRSDRQRLGAGLRAVMAVFCAAVLFCFVIFLVIDAIRGGNNLPIVVVPLLALLLISVSARFVRSGCVEARAARAEPGRVGIGPDALTFVCPEMFPDPLVIPRQSITKVTLPPADRGGMSYDEARGMTWIKMSLLADSPNCGVFLERPTSLSRASRNEIRHPTGWGPWPGTAPPVKGKPFQVIWLRTADWTGARALRSWADGVSPPLLD